MRFLKLQEPKWKFWKFKDQIEQNWKLKDQMSNDILKVQGPK